MNTKPKTQRKPQRKRFVSKGKGKTYAKAIGKEAERTEAIETELDKQTTIKAKLADIERRQAESQARETYHELRLREVNTDGKEA